MPELPEVETVRRRLAPHVVGRTIAAAEITDLRLTRPEPPPLVAARLRGDRVSELERRGKYLLIGLGSGATLVVHLRMTGNLRWQPEPFELAFTRASLLLDDGSTVVYTDVRRFGTWQLSDDPAALLAQTLGPEPLADWSAGDLRRALADRSTPVKAALLDQRTVAGIGNIYADEALFRAGIHPRTPAARIGPARAARLHAAIRGVLEEGIAAQGASIRDFRTPDGGYGSAQERFLVYGKGGQPCERCGGTLSRTVVAQRGTIYCRSCQRR